MVFGSPSQSDLKKSVQLCALPVGRGSVRAAAGPSIKNSDRHWKTRTTARCLRCRRNRGSLIVPIANSNLFGCPNGGVQIEPLAAARTEPRPTRSLALPGASPYPEPRPPRSLRPTRSLALPGPTKQAAPLTLKVACMASPSRFDRREDRRCNSTNLQTFGILQTMLASNFALNDLRAIQI